MEKIVHFSVFKEKIIKTNELLHLHLEKTRELEKVKTCYEQLKVKFQQTTSELNKFKLRNETLEYNLKIIEKDYGPLKAEHNKLKQQFAELETESGNTINNLQISYQLANRELKETKDKLASFDETKNDFIEVKATTKKGGKKKGKSPVKVNPNLELLKNVEKLTKAKAKCLKENVDLKMEIYECKKQFKLLRVDQERLKHLDSELTDKQSELCRLKNEFKGTVEMKNAEIETLSQNIQNFIKQNDANKNQIVQTNIKEIPAHVDKATSTDFGDFVLETEPSPEIMNYDQETVRLRSNSGTPSDEQVEEILKEVTIPLQLTPITEIEPKFVDESINEEDAPQTKTQTQYTDLDFMSRALIRRNIRKKRLKERRKSKKSLNADLIKVLLQLQRNNINFVIDNGQSRIESHPHLQVMNPSFHHYKQVIDERECKNTTLSELKCNLQCCKSYMAKSRSRTDGSSALLGFVEIKDEKDKKIKENCSLSRTLPTPICDNNKKGDIFLKINRKNVECHRQISVIDGSGQKERNAGLASLSSVDSNNICNAAEIDKPEERGVDGGFNEQNFNSDPNKNAGTMLVASNKIINHKSSKKKKNNSILKLFAKRRKFGLLNSNDSDLEQDSNDTQLTLSSLDKLELAKTPKVARKPKFEGVRRSPRLEKNHAQPQSDDMLTNTETSKEKNTEGDLTKLEFLPIRGGDNIKKAFKKSVGGHFDQNETVQNSLTGIQFSETVSRVFKKPVCRARRSLRLSEGNQCGNNTNERDPESACFESPLSPPMVSAEDFTTPMQIPLDKVASTNSNIREEEENCTNISSAASSITPLENTEGQQTFKRPVCLGRMASRTSERIPEESQQSEAEFKAAEVSKISLASGAERPMTPAKMPTSKIEALFKKLVIFSKEEEALNDVVRQFLSQEPQYVAEAILQRVSVDYHDKADAKYVPAPIMTDVQRTMLGFMAKLEQSSVRGVFDSYLSLAERKLLTCENLHEIEPITRLYLAVCKQKKYLYRLRKLCCDMFYFSGDFALPFFFVVLTSWTEVLPHAVNCNEMPLAKVLIQLIYTKDCNKPGYNLLPLRDLLIKFYGYPSERWDINAFFEELLFGFLKNPVRSSDFALLLYCKNRPEKWVYEKIDEHLKPLINQIPKENLKATVIILVGNLYSRFSSKSELNYLPKIREWFTSLVDETTPDVVKRSVYLCLNRLRKK